MACDATRPALHVGVFLSDPRAVRGRHPRRGEYQERGAALFAMLGLEAGRTVRTTASSTASGPTEG